MKLEYMYLGLLKTKIVKLMWKNKYFDRDTLADKLGYARTTVFDNLQKSADSLLKRGIVDKKSLGSTGKRGRPSTVWFLTEHFIKEMGNELENDQENIIPN